MNPSTPQTFNPAPKQPSERVTVESIDSKQALTEFLGVIKSITDDYERSKTEDEYKDAPAWFHTELKRVDSMAKNMNGFDNFFDNFLDSLKK